jgi:hypothetical protein
MSQLSAPLLVDSPQLLEVIPLELKYLDLNATEAPSQENTPFPSHHQISHLYEQLSSYEMASTPDSCKVYQCTPTNMPNSVLGSSLFLASLVT